MAWNLWFWLLMPLSSSYFRGRAWSFKEDCSLKVLLQAFKVLTMKWGSQWIHHSQGDRNSPSASGIWECLMKVSHNVNILLIPKVSLLSSVLLEVSFGTNFVSWYFAFLKKNAFQLKRCSYKTSFVSLWLLERETIVVNIF